MLAYSLEIGHSLVTGHHFACDWNIFPGQLCHALFDRYQIFRRKRTRIREIVVKTIFDNRAYGDLSLGKQLLDCICHQMRCGVSYYFQTIRILVGNDGQASVLSDLARSIHQPAINLASQRCASQTRTYAGGYLGYRYRFVITALRTIRQCDYRHIVSLLMKNAAKPR